MQLHKNRRKNVERGRENSMKKKMNRFKCFLMTLLSLVMVFVSSATAFASEPSLQRPEDPVNESNYFVPGFQGMKYFIKGTDVQLRRNPGLSGEVLGLLDADGRDPWVVLTGEFADVDGIRWAQVSDSSLGFGGWVVVNGGYLYADEIHWVQVSDSFLGLGGWVDDRYIGQVIY